MSSLHAYFEKIGLYPGDAFSQHLDMGVKYVDLLRASLQSTYSISNFDANALIISELVSISTKNPIAFSQLAAS